MVVHTAPVRPVARAAAAKPPRHGRPLRPALPGLVSAAARQLARVRRARLAAAAPSRRCLPQAPSLRLPARAQVHDGRLEEWDEGADAHDVEERPGVLPDALLPSRLGR